MADKLKLPKASHSIEVGRRVAELNARAKRSAPMHASATAAAGQSIEAKIDIDQEVAREQQLKNENVAQDIRLKKTTLNRLFLFLTIETGLIFMFAFFQAINWPHDFALEDWSFRLVLAATIAQITGMLFVAVRYLFPKTK